MARFSERIGKREARSVIQTDELDSETRTALWNTMYRLQGLLDDDAQIYSVMGRDHSNDFASSLWANVFHQPHDEMMGLWRVWQNVKSTIQDGEWYEVFDLLEFGVKELKQLGVNIRDRDVSAFLVKALSGVFEKYLVGYRFIGLEITPVDSKVEANAIADAIDGAATLNGVRHNLERAVELLSDRKTPDYANSIKESISAVESLLEAITTEKTLSAGIKNLDKYGLSLHPALKDGWVKLYGWTSDEAAIRHGGAEAPTVGQAKAKYMLVTCSAFVSYLIEEASERDLL